MQSANHQSRRAFLRHSGGLATASAILSLSGTQSGAAEAAANTDQSRHHITAVTDSHYYLSDVRLEEGFEHEGEVVVGTRTGIHTLEIQDGRIKALHDAGAALDASLPRYKAQGKLLLPAFRDMHIHLDKTFYGGQWQAPLPRQGKTIMDMIAREEVLLPKLLPTSQTRAERLIDLLLSQGSSVARSHCNIDPVSGLKSLEHLQLALANYRDSFECEIVAFPQHGLLHSKVDGLMREAMSMGVHYVGGLDPTNVDGAMEASLDAMFQIALDHDKGVDIHIHETHPAGVAALNYMIATVEKTPALRNRLTLSHAFALSTLRPEELNEMAGRMAAHGVTVVSTVPIGQRTMPLPQLRAKGVTIMTGTDSVIDHWSPFGSGDMLEKANLCAQLYGGSDEFRLSRSLAIATGDVLPLSDDGKVAWPKPGDTAEFVLVDASCSAEAVARRSPRRATFHKGRLVYGAVERA
ncbi:amidohydrolase family protein [Microvirga lotononidis]|uniref:Cytosine deaminase-like metal-dependent hydrolase n=1 Tax=Microvirga lotononidis TaxID=864069 RepID=I4YYG0_9HYPH|nr:amidohydrolase family protein [Microvirga lotononidis]EIM29002.1 cytosine deaminase-like metal-dependent hydrolase [Microvirga lotononidis]WQO31311.1 amidohydrolase family protein [Microvirga lotononidis]